ncbi:rod-binding protein [Campylobacter fetus]|uniref:Rod-binding protein n=3 Tax=Campylobacter fetus TaxID=196 RepID=A0A5L8V932_CAMFE|nr:MULTISPECIES: rod-binding protein [Campylobacter]OCS22521.1 rod-binding protein [Campylobacter fetus subsp. venerealis cfvi97/532]OCS25701.1 rod-binding protein [Campylobacter fetus subsp. venerealis cfvB10]OCS29916.1 rod-binding protein [Campylobacter fetus subsp. venerealis LMG 6570 = CCUG 33900]OCS43197.1 rod-binding protein [Campylobacter fetus subsp. venerealis cfvi02/298]ABK83367.1 conserved hypothetical protein [Campylobacter fetus subsp. fetus 82-40]
MQVDNSLALDSYNSLSTSSINSNLKDSKNDELLREQTDAFEAFLLKEVLDISIKNENSLFPQDAGDKIYSSMYNDTMSKALSGGLGFSEMLFNFLKERN